MEDAQRINEIHRYSGMTWRQLAQTLGIASTQTFTDIRKGKHGISKSLAKRIVDNFPALSNDWVMLGEGNMLRGAEMPHHGIFSTNPINSLFADADAFIANNSDAMAEYPKGSILPLKNTDITCIIQGGIYAFATDSDILIRRAGNIDGTITLWATSREMYADGSLVYPPVEIPVSSIRNVYKVLGFVMRTSSARL